MKRFLLLFAILSVPAHANTVTQVSNASQNSGTTRAVQEPVIAAQSLNGVTHGLVAFMNFHDQVNAKLDVQIQVSHTYDFVNWSVPQNLPLGATNGVTYEHSADPVLLDYGNNYPYFNWLFCFGTLYSKTPQHGKDSTIGVWHSTDGGLTWSAPDAIDNPQNSASCECPPENPNCQDRTCIFDDKPAVAMSLANGVVFVAFTHTTADVLNQQGQVITPSSTTIYMSELLPTRGWASIGQIGDANQAGLAGPTPVVDTSTNICHLFVKGTRKDEVNNTFIPTIKVYTSGDGWIWTLIPEVVDAPGMDIQGVIVGNATVRAASFFAAKFDSIYRHIVVLYHRSGNGLTQVVYRRFVPFSHAWTEPGAIAGNGHTQWNPTLVQLSNGHFVASYYDYAPGDAGYTLYAARMDLYGIWVENSRIFNSFLSNPAGYNMQGGTFANIGEYQGLTVLNDTLYAASTQIQNGAGNAWAVKFTSP